MKYQTILILLLISLIASIALAIGEQDSSICGEDGSSSCSIVSQSQYSQFYGIKNSYLGIGIFLLLSIITYSHLRMPRKGKLFIINMGVLIGAIVAAYFIYLQAFVLKTFCPYCMVVDVSMILAFLVIFVFKRRKRY